MTGTRSFTAGVATLVVFATIVGPAAAAPWDDPELTQVTFGADATPSWTVHVEDGEMDALEDWAAGSNDREVIRTHNASNTAVVTGSPAAAGQRLRDRILNNGLAERSYVVAVRPNYQHTLARPVNPQNLSAIEAPGRTLRTLATIGSRGAASWTQSGIAYADTTNESTIGEAQAVMGVDNVSATGEGATAAVIDSGCNVGNGRVFGNGTAGSDVRLLNASKDFVANETVAADGTDAVEDPNGHGTFVASQVLANTSDASYDGVAPDADLLCLRALDENGQGSTGDIADAVRYAADHDADAIVMSLGSPIYDGELTRALEYAVEQNVSSIAIAAGNSRQTTRWLATPADAPVDGVTAVSATNTSGNATAGSAYFANVGSDPGTTDASGGATASEDVDVAAPGIKVQAKTVSPSGTVSNETLSGTSMAAPHVTGVALLGVESGEAWTGDAAAFRNSVRDTARPMPNAAEIEVGGGMVAADRLLTNETDGDQSDAMDEDAEARDSFWRGLSSTSPWVNFDVPVVG